LFARYGGEEFAIVLPGADAAEGGRVAERVRKSICASPFDLTDVPCKENSTDVTVSCGVSAREPGSRDTLKSAATLLRAADKAVYAAKESGRNRVRVVRLRPPGQAKNPAPAAAPDADSHSDAAATHESPVEAGAAPSAEAGIEPAARLKILVVEDEKLQQKLITLPLENSGEYEPIVAADATTALKHLGIEPASDPLNPSFMLIDLGLPDFSGVELVRRIREHEAYKITPIVILSASEVANDVAAVMNAGANAFVAKNEIADDPRRRVLDLAAFWSRMIPAAAA
jgi:PleD family two-component response regulator